MYPYWQIHNMSFYKYELRTIPATYMTGCAKEIIEHYGLDYFIEKLILFLGGNSICKFVLYGNKILNNIVKNIDEPI